MAKTSAATTQVSIIAETVDGTTPATPAFTVLRATGENLQAERKHVYSSELNGHRGPRNFAIASSSGSGSIEIEYTDTTFEALIASALRGTWAADVVTNDFVTTTYTVESKFEAGGTDVYKRIKGAQVSTLALSCKAAEIVTGSIGFLARFGDVVTTAETGATYVAANTNPLNTGVNVGSLTMGALTFDAPASISLSLNNKLRLREVLGSLNPVDIGAGDLEISATLVFFLDSTAASVFRAGLDGTTAGLSFEIAPAGAGNNLRIELPTLVVEPPQFSAPSSEGDVMVTLQCKALQSPTLGNKMIRVTRNV
jgi:hypothetical protein